MTSTLDLVLNSKVIPERNFKLPDLNAVRTSGDSHSVVSNFQYIKHSMNLTIKLDLSQSHLEYITANNTNYILIKNSGESSKEVGYFVVNKKWLSESTIEYTLQCDTINSFLDTCELSDKTKILRQHKDRWTKTGGVAHIDRVRAFSGPFEIGGDYYVGFGLNEQYGGEYEATLLFDFNGYNQHPAGSSHNYLDIDYDLDYQPISCTTTFYWLDENYNIISQIGNASSLANVSLANVSYGYGAGITYNNTRYSKPSNARYLAIRCNGIYEDEEDCSIAFEFGISEDDYDPEEIYDALDMVLANVGYWFTSRGRYVPAEPIKLYPVIDMYSEDIRPVLYGRTLGYLQDKKLSESLNQDWYLVYETQNAPSQSLENPVDCYVVPEYSLTLYPYNVATSITYDGDEFCDLIDPVANGNFSQNKQGVVVNFADNIGLSVNITDDTGSTLANFTLSAGAQGGMIFVPVAEHVVQCIISGKASSGASPLNIWPFYIFGLDTYTIRFSGGKKAVVGDVSGESIDVSTMPDFNLFGNQLPAGPITLDSIESVDRTNAKLIKIIKLPYCPINLIESQGTLFYDSTHWQASSGKLRLVKSANAKSINDLQRTIFFQEHLNPFSALGELGFVPAKISDRNDSFYEPKLHHSDYYQPKVVYDSFSFTFQLELVNKGTETNCLRVQYNVSSLINSRFMFTFSDYVSTYYEIKDYNNIMYISRNNEIAIFNQQYLNYLRTGYNYDQKIKEIRFDELAVSTGKSGGYGIIDKTTSGFTKGGTAGAIMGFGRGAMDFGEQLYKMANDIAITDYTLASKIASLQNGATGVIDANDCDLLEVYSKNRLKYMVYEVSPKMKKVLGDLFFYTGYVAGTMGLPDTTSRIWFNYVSAEIVFVKTPNIPAEMINDIKSRYASGITFLHSFYNSYTQKYEIDYAQVHENWETSIVDELS